MSESEETTTRETTSELFRMFMDTMDPQARFNMELAVRMDELERAKDGPDTVTDELIELQAVEIAKLRGEISGLKDEMKVLRGALEETINQLRELQKESPKVMKAVRDTQARAAARTPSGALSRAKQYKGVFCRNCGNRLEGKHQTLFCSRKCGARWRAQHPDETATPRLTLDDKNGFSATVEAGAGVKSGSVSG